MQSAHRIERSPERRVRRAAFLGFTVDMYDIYLPVIALAPAIVYFQPAGELSEPVQTTLYYLAFVATLVGRPIGAVLFGHWADRIGRRRTMLISVAGFTVTTLIIAALPGYALVGLAGVVLLIVFRLVDGIFLGGEYTAASPLAMESSSTRNRGFNGAFITAGYAVASAAISVVTLGLLEIIPAGDQNAPYAIWGWRIPFVLGAVFSLALFLYIRRALPESKAWEQAPKATSSPLKEMVRGESGRSLRQVFVLMTGVWLVFLSVASTIPSVLGGLGVKSGVVTGGLVVANAVLFLGYLGFGVLGQRFGRKKILIVGGILNLVVTPILYYVLIAAGYQNTVAMVLLVVVLTVLAVGGTLAIPLAYLTERFPTRVRASGYGIGWSISLIIPSFYSFAMLGIGTFIPYSYSHLPLIVIGAAIMIAGAAMGPETKDVDLQDPHLGRGTGVQADAVITPKAADSG